MGHGIQHGIPDIVQLDNGPQFSSGDFGKFADDYGFIHKTSSPHMHQANGAVERAVQTAKKILDCDDIALALLNYRSTPTTATGVSPAEALMGRKLKTKLPVMAHNLLPQQPVLDGIGESDKSAKGKYKLHYDRRHGVRPLAPLQPGQPVLTKLDDDKSWKRL